jgi:hypothetical protein
MLPTALSQSRSLREFSLLLAGCGVVAEHRRQEQMPGDVALAKQFYKDDIHGAACIVLFRRTMNDPDSFQLAGPFQYNSIATQVWWGTDWDGGKPRRVVYTAPFRGKNAYGALILSELQCQFTIESEGLQLLKAYSM